MTGPIGTFNPNKCRRFDFTAMKNILRAFAFSLLASAAFGQGVLITVQKLNDGSNNLTAPINVGSGTAVHIKSGASLIADAGSTIAGFSGSGSVTSVGLSLPAAFTVSGSPVTTTGTLTAIWANENANLFLAGPSSGSAAAPTFRGIAAADLPLATTGAFGAVKPDGSTITISGGVISASGSGSGTVTSIGPANGSLTFSPNPITSTGTIGLNVANANTWTVPQFINVASQGVTANAGFTIENLTAATSGTQQFSPLLAFRGSGWGTTAPGAQSVVFGWQNQPVQGTTAPTGNFVLYSQINGGSLTNVFQVSDSGVPTFGAAFSAPNGSTATTQTVGDNTTNIATDAFVLANGGGGGGGNAVVVANVAAMEAYSLSGLSTGSGISTLGYYKAGDGGGINCTLNTSSSATSDGVIYFPTSGSGRWIQTFPGSINLKQAGCYGDTNNMIPCVVSISSSSTTLTITGAVFAFLPKNVGQTISIAGAGTSGGTLTTTISGYTDYHQVTLTASAGTTLTNVSMLAPSSPWAPAALNFSTPYNVSISSSSNVLTVVGGSFVASDVGKTIYVQGAGAGSVGLWTTISAFTSATQVTLAATAGTTLTNAANQVIYGHDDTTQTIAACKSSYSIYVPNGAFSLTSVVGLPGGTQGPPPYAMFGGLFKGAGSGASVFIWMAPGGSGTMFNFANEGGKDEISGITFYSPTTTSGSILMDGSYSQRVYIHDCMFWNDDEGFSTTLGYTFFDRIFGNSFGDQTTAGVYMTHGPGGPENANYIEHNKFQCNGTYGVYLAGISGDHCYANNISFNDFEGTATTAAVELVFADGTTGIGNYNETNTSFFNIGSTCAFTTILNGRYGGSGVPSTDNGVNTIRGESSRTVGHLNMGPIYDSATAAVLNIQGGTDGYSYADINMTENSNGYFWQLSHQFGNGFILGYDGAAGFKTWLEVSTAGAFQWPAYGAGTATFDSSGNITSVSDARYKNIDGAFDRGLGAVLGLHPTVFHWNKMSGLNQNDVNAGFIAQDVLKSIPEAVGKNKAGYYTLADRPITAALVNAVKELTLFVAGAILLGIANLVLVIRNRKK